MSKKSDGGSAFPYQGWQAARLMGISTHPDTGKEYNIWDEGRQVVFPGMTMRQWYAGMALQGIYAHPDKIAGSFSTPTGREAIAAVCFHQADAMIAHEQAETEAGEV